MVVKVIKTLETLSLTLIKSHTIVKNATNKLNEVQKNLLFYLCLHLSQVGSVNLKNLKESRAIIKNKFNYVLAKNVSLQKNHLQKTIKNILLNKNENAYY